MEPLPFVKINDPTVEMTFSVNDSPLAGREGKFVTSRQIRDRLHAELLKDVALKVEDSATTIPSVSWAVARCTCPSSSRPCAVKAMSCRSLPRTF